MSGETAANVVEADVLAGASGSLPVQRRARIADDQPEVRCLAVVGARDHLDVAAGGAWRDAVLDRVLHQRLQHQCWNRMRPQR